MNRIFKLNLLIIIFSLVMFIIVISCGGGGGGGIIPIGGGGSGGSGGGGSGSPNISFNNQGYLIVQTKANSINTNTVNFNFQTVNPNVLANTNEFNRNINNSYREYKCGFIPSTKNQANQNIYYSITPPNVGDFQNFPVYNFAATPPVETFINAKCVHVNDNPKYAIWVDTANTGNYNEEDLYNNNSAGIISHFNNNYNTLTANIGALNFYVDILITEKIDTTTGEPTTIGYFAGFQDPQRVNVHPFTFSLNYGSYNEFNVTLAHEFVHLLEYNKTTIGNHERWIAEGLATYGEDLCGYSGQVRINSIISFFNNPETTPLITSDPSFANYGKSFLFIKQLDQRFTNAWSNMVTSNLDGINLIENINGSEDFLTTVDKFNIAVLLDTNDNNPTYDFIDLNLNSATFNNGIYRFNGWNNGTLQSMGAASTMSRYSAYYLYKNAGFNGNILVNSVNLLFNDFVDTVAGPWSIKQDDFNNSLRFIVVYR